MRLKWLSRVSVAVASICFAGAQTFNQASFAQTENMPPVIEGGWHAFGYNKTVFKTAKEACLQGYTPKHIDLWTDDTGEKHPHGSITHGYCGMEGWYEEGYGHPIQAVCYPSESQITEQKIYLNEYIFLGDLGGGICIHRDVIKKLIAEGTEYGDTGYVDTSLQNQDGYLDTPLQGKKGGLGSTSSRPPLPKYPSGSNYKSLPLTPAQIVNMRKIDEISHLLQSRNNLSGQILDAGHVTKLQNARTGLTKSRNGLQGSLNNPYLPPTARGLIQSKINHANNLVNRINKLVGEQ
jgi:hypothetical protein